MSIQKEKAKRAHLSKIQKKRISKEILNRLNSPKDNFLTQIYFVIRMFSKD